MVSSVFTAVSLGASVIARKEGGLGEPCRLPPPFLSMRCIQTVRRSPSDMACDAAPFCSLTSMACAVQRHTTTGCDSLPKGPVFFIIHSGRAAAFFLALLPRFLKYGARKSRVFFFNFFFCQKQKRATCAPSIVTGVRKQQPAMRFKLKKN